MFTKKKKKKNCLLEPLKELGNMVLSKICTEKKIIKEQKSQTSCYTTYLVCLQQVNHLPIRWFMQDW